MKGIDKLGRFSSFLDGILTIKRGFKCLLKEYEPILASLRMKPLFYTRNIDAPQIQKARNGNNPTFWLQLPFDATMHFVYFTI
jgi:hypothetical protein